MRLLDASINGSQLIRVRQPNFYTYVGNDPLDRTDPSGECGPCAIAIWEAGEAALAAWRAYKAAAFVTSAAAAAAAANDAIHNSSSSSSSNNAAPPAAPPAPVSTPATPPDPEKEPHGNSNSSTKPQHRYEIRDSETNDAKKTGISGEELNENGSSPRANKQVNAANRAGGTNKYKATVKETNIPGRAAAKQAEKNATNELNAQGNSLEWQKLPQPEQLKP
jgi:pyruvate/2-oxoglutarate dehydrogenase complex dihydrolipoamide acyltransferase (E2) component